MSTLTKQLSPRQCFFRLPVVLVVAYYYCCSCDFYSNTFYCGSGDGSDGWTNHTCRSKQEYNRYIPIIPFVTVPVKVVLSLQLQRQLLPMRKRYEYYVSSSSRCCYDTTTTASSYNNNHIRQMSSRISSTSSSSLSSSFLGVQNIQRNTDDNECSTKNRMVFVKSFLYMRKQKASDRRTSRRQRGDDDTTYNTAAYPSASAMIMTTTSTKYPPVQQQLRSLSKNNNPMRDAIWNVKTVQSSSASSSSSSGSFIYTSDAIASFMKDTSPQQQLPPRRPGHGSSSKLKSSTSIMAPTPPHSILAVSSNSAGGRGRSKKRSRYYETLQFYHHQFLDPLTLEYQAEEYEVLNRIRRSIIGFDSDSDDVGTGSTMNANSNSGNDPILYERNSGYVLYDMSIERRGTLFTTQHVYRLTKAIDATTSFERLDDSRTKGITNNNDANNEKYRNTTNSGSTTAKRTSSSSSSSSNSNSKIRFLPSNHKFSKNDVIILTQQLRGSGDFYTEETLPIHDDAITAEATVLSTGPTYVDIVMMAGTFEQAFQCLPSNDHSGYGNVHLRLRVDHYISNVPYTRMVNALSQLTSISSSPSSSSSLNADKTTTTEKQTVSSSGAIHMDNVIRDVIVQTLVCTHPYSPLYGNTELGSSIQELVRTKVVQPPMKQTSIQLAQQFLSYVRQASPMAMKHSGDTGRPFRNNHPPYNTPQLAAIEAALTRRITLIQGPPGTGKTSVAAAIACGFAHQCRYLNSNNNNKNSNTTKVLACAFSNVGADNLAEAMISLGLNVVRVGKPSAVSESLWNYTLDAAIDHDETAQRAIQHAISVTSQLALLNSNKQGTNGKTSLSSSGNSNNSKERNIRDAATAAVKASILASNIAATKALRNADVIVATSIGSADARLLTACGILLTDSDSDDSINKNNYPTNEKRNKNSFPKTRVSSSKSSSSSSPSLSAQERSDLAPDGLPPISLPFVIIDEACQSIEPATLIPIVSSDSCRALVLLGDQCQLPPTVKSPAAQSLSLSLMERLAATLPNPNVIPAVDTTIKDVTYLTSSPIKDAVSLVRSRSQSQSGTAQQPKSYRKMFTGSILLSIQYRMHPSIAAIPSAIFYDGMLASPQVMNELRTFPPILNQLMPCADPNVCVRLIDVGGHNNERQGTPTTGSNNLYSRAATATDPLLVEQQQTTYWNDAEAQRVVVLLKEILTDPSVSTIGIISPYNGQVQRIKLIIGNDAEIRDLIARRQTPNKRPISIEVNSVDGYQGRERDVIIVSTVRSNRRNQIGFVTDWRRMNVAMTRAKSALLIVGDLQTLSTADKHWGALYRWSSAVGCVV